MNFDELLKEAKEKDKQGKAKAKVTLGSVGTKKTLPIPLASPSKAGEERAESALFRSQKTPAALAEEKSVVKLLPRAIGAGLARAPLNIAKAVPALAAATLAEGGTSKRYEEANKYTAKPVSAEQMKKAQEIAGFASKISYPGTAIDEFIAKTEKDLQALETPGSRLFGQTLMAAGQMAPVIATGGIAGAGAGLATLGAGVYGQSFGEAIERGSDVKTAGQYAALSSALELATETLVGGIPGLGKGLLSKIIQTPSAVNLASRIGVKSASNVFAKTASAVGKTLSSKGGRLLVNAFGEGIEEVIAEYLAPSIERSTIDPNAPDATISELAESFAVGGLLSALLGVPSITLSNGKTITKLDDVDTLTKHETKEFEDELYKLARESNIRKGKITPQGEPIQAFDAETMANERGLPTPQTKPVENKTISEKAKKEFGVTSNPLEAGYILSDGQMLDFSGKKDGGESNVRNMDHREIQELYEDKQQTDAMNQFILDTGSVRISVDARGDFTADISGTIPLTEKQIERIKKLSARKQYVTIDYYESPLQNNPTESFELDFPTVKQVDDVINKTQKTKMSKSQPTTQAEQFLVGPAKTIPTTNIPQRMVQPIPQQTLTPQPAFEPLNRPVGQTGGTLLSPQNELETQDLGIVGIPSEKTAKYAETVQEFETVSKELSDEIINTIQQGKLEGTFKSNKAVVENANNYIAQGLQNARGAFDVSINDNRYTSESIALGARLVQEYQKIGDLQNAMSVLSDLAFALQAAGQKVQAAKILKKLTPEGRLKTLAALKNKIEAKAGVQVELSDEILKQVSEAKTENEMAKAFGNARIEIWNKIPATFEDKFNAWRYTSMLGNPKTIMRNEIGNALFAPVRTVKNIIASGLEKVARIPSGANALEDNIERFIETGKTGSIRTKSILTNTDKDLVQFALKDTENVLEILKGDSKYGDLGSAEALTSRPIGTKVFNQDTILGRAIQKWSDVTTKALEDGLSVGNFKIIQGDASWLERIYSKSLAQFMKANNLNESDMTGIVLDIGRAYAIQEAKKGTYRDANIVSSWLSKNIRKGTKSDKLIPKAIGYIAEGAIPFKRTPMNIARRAIEYSPIGLINGVASTVQSIKNGENISVALDKLAAGLTGTGVVGLGMFLASLGLLSGGDSGDDKEEKYKDALGVQNYALQIGDKSYTVDWAAPSSIPLFVGVELYNQLKNGFELSDMLDAMKNVSDPLLEMSMLQGIANIMDTGYSQGGFDVILTPIKTSALSLAGQAVPTVFGQIARTIDPSLRRTNTSDAKSPALKDIEYGLKRNILSKIPVAQQTRQPYVDLWGRTPVKTSAGDYVKSALENFLSVGYVSEENITSVDRQIISIYKDTEDNSVIPRSTTGYDIKVAGEEYRMSEDEKTEFQKNRGKQSYDKLKSLFLTNEYGKMTTEERVKAINDVYDDAYEVAKKQLAISRGMKEIDYNINTLSKESKAKIDSIVSAGIPKNTAYNIFIKKDANGNGSLSQDELMQVISLSKTTQKQKAALWDILKVQTWKKQNPFLQ